MQTLVLFQQGGVLDLLTLDQGRVARGSDDHLTQHLANDHLDVLVVDLHTLQSINLLDLVDDVLGQLFNALQAQNIVGAGRSFRNHFTLLDIFTFEHRHVTPLGNQRLVVIGAIRQRLTDRSG